MEQGVRAQLACQQGRVAGDVGQECVEVARNIPGTVAFRDSKDVTGPIVVVARPPGRRSRGISRGMWGSGPAARLTDRRPARGPRAATRAFGDEVSRPASRWDCTARA
ncbi:MULTISPECIES: DUF397 domain-containing protein [unclassified Streptomyces]|uniref:DUF397 domain-containing protein n=1 Tax=unclassified Streptomyces TaxID=2593676 RepID=UPI002259A5D2|nr:DUF397 domain-containing protein [Streptomyces sp. NBC_01764]MCX4410623.1 DUF397 domain-containing protein [Streptomyces sp. NBC_01764]MCX5186817.1 DUF397 domain-containing protein [Streptomyces sp. NBC_00268]